MPTSSVKPLSFQNFILAISGVLIIWLTTIFLHLTMALFAFLITFTAVRGLTQWLRKIIPNRMLRNSVALIIVLCLQALALVLLIHFSINAGKTHSDFSALLQQIVDILTRFKISLPDSLAKYIPGDVDQIRADFAKWLQTHSQEIKTLGKNALHVFGYLIVGIVIAGIAVFQVDERPEKDDRPLAAIIFREFSNITNAFANVVFAQTKISIINTFLTGIYLLGILPMVGHPLPMTKTLLLFTLIVGLIPVIGNLMSNTAIILISLGDSSLIVVMSFAWLFLIHKLEYFLNAEIIGRKIHAKAWELLAMMLLLEACFGVVGVICAPIIYAQIKRICLKNGWLISDSSKLNHSSPVSDGDS